MTVHERTQVGIVGAGPAGLLLSHLLALGGVDSVCVENRSRAYCEARQRAGMLESTTVELLRETGLGTRLDAEGLEHDGIYVQFDGERHHLNFRELTGGRWITIYAQTEIVKDIIAARTAAGAALEFEVSDTAVSGLDTARPVLSYTDARGSGTWSPATSSPAATASTASPAARSRPAGSPCSPSAPTRTPGSASWPPPRRPPTRSSTAGTTTGSRCTACAPRRSAGSTCRCRPTRTSPGGRTSGSGTELATRFALPGWSLTSGPVLQKSITPMRSFVAAPMRYGNLFLAGDAAHIVPPTGAKGLNLAVADVAALATALIRLIRDGDAELAAAYSDYCLERVWRSTHLSWWMTSMLHIAPDQDEFESELQLAQLRHLVSSRTAAAALAETYTGYRPLRFDPSTRLDAARLWPSVA